MFQVVDLEMGEGVGWSGRIGEVRGVAVFAFGEQVEKCKAEIREEVDFESEKRISQIRKQLTSPAEFRRPISKKNRKNLTKFVIVVHNHRAKRSKYTKNLPRGMQLTRLL